MTVFAADAIFFLQERTFFSVFTSCATVLLSADDIDRQPIEHCPMKEKKMVMGLQRKLDSCVCVIVP